MPATVDFVEELGSGRIVHAEIAGETFSAAIGEDLLVKPGQRIHFELPPPTFTFSIRPPASASKREGAIETTRIGNEKLLAV